MGTRAERVARSVIEELGMLLPSVKDPAVAEAGLITVTHVRVSDDLGVARVLITLAPDGEVNERRFEVQKKALLDGLRRAAPWLRRELAKTLPLKKLPELRFFYDDVGAKADRVDELLREIAAERVARGEPAPEPVPLPTGGGDASQDPSDPEDE